MDEIPILGEDAALRELATSEDHREAALGMTTQARRYLCIFTRDLDPLIFDNDAFQEACSALARNMPRAHVHVLVQDAGRASREGHRLVMLAQRLSSKVEIRRPHQEYATYNSAFLTVDDVGYIRRPLADRYEGAASYNDPATARELTRFFGEVWQKSHADPQLRRLHL